MKKKNNKSYLSELVEEVFNLRSELTYTVGHRDQWHLVLIDHIID